MHVGDLLRAGTSANGRAHFLRRGLQIVERRMHRKTVDDRGGSGNDGIPQVEPAVFVEGRLQSRFIGCVQGARQQEKENAGAQPHESSHQSLGG